MEWKALVDKTLGTHFDAPVYNPETGRKKLAKAIDKAAEQFSSGTKPPLRSWKVGSNDAVRFKPTIDGKPIIIDGDDHMYVPVERFQDFLKGLKKSVLAGDLDKEIKAAVEGEKPAAGRKASSTNTVSDGTRGGRTPLSNARSSITRYMTNGKTLDEAEQMARANAKGRFSDADIDAVIAEKRAASA